MANLTGKQAIVLGAGRAGNIGQAIARRLAADGATVTVVGRDAAVLEALAREIDGHIAICDITQDGAASALVDTVLKRSGRIDIAVNAIGVSVTAPALETTRADLVALLETNFIAPFLLVQALVRGMPQGGSIIHLTSATATVLLENHAAYMGAKAGFDRALAAMADEFGARGIRINSVAPGLTRSPMTEAVFAFEPVLDLFRREYPLGRIGTSEDIAAACSWLAADDCFVTGQTIQVNGGLTLRRNPRWGEVMAAMSVAMGASS